VHEVIRRMIHEVVSDLIEESARRIAAAQPADIDAVRASPGPLIGFSAEREAEHRQMKKFLRTRLYRHEKMQAARLGAGKVLEELFQAFMADVARMPSEHRNAALTLESKAGSAGRARAVADYIAGMTDRYAFQEHARLLA
jgi:dGTPase